MQLLYILKSSQLMNVHTPKNVWCKNYHDLSMFEKREKKCYNIYNDFTYI